MVFLEVPQQNKGILLNTNIHQSETNENLQPGEKISLVQRGFLWMNLLEKLVLERSMGGGEGCLGCRETRGDLPVCFRCGKRRLPVDSIRASSGFYVRGERAKGKIVRVEGEGIRNMGRRVKEGKKPDPRSPKRQWTSHWGKVIMIRISKL